MSGKIQTPQPVEKPITLGEWAEAHGIDSNVLRKLLIQHSWSSVATDFDADLVLTEVAKIVNQPHGYAHTIPLHAEQAEGGAPPQPGTFRRAGRPDTLRGRRAMPTVRGGRS